MVDTMQVYNNPRFESIKKYPTRMRIYTDIGLARRKRAVPRVLSYESLIIALMRAQVHRVVMARYVHKYSHTPARLMACSRAPREACQC